MTFTENTCIAITTGMEKATYTVVDCEGSITPEPEPLVGTYYITGNDALLSENVWEADAILMTHDGSEVTHTFKNVPAGSYCQFKITMGDWSQNWGYDAVANRPAGVSGDMDGNVVFTMASTSDVKVTFDGTNISLTGDFVVSSTPDIETTTYYIGGNAPLIGNEIWDPKAITMTQVDDYHMHIFKNVPAGQECKFKITNGTWDVVWGYSNVVYNLINASASNSGNIVFTLGNRYCPST